MREIPVGTVVYKKVYVDGEDTPCGCGCKIKFKKEVIVAKKEAIVAMTVLEPGFIADSEFNTPDIDNYHQKGRVRKAAVLSITNLDGSALDTDSDIISMHDKTFKYAVDAVVEPRLPFDEQNVACANGIHCFLTREQAVKYSG